MEFIEPVEGERRTFGAPTEAVEADIRQGYLAYLSEVADGLWPGESLGTAISFAVYRRDYWREELPALEDGTY